MPEQLTQLSVENETHYAVDRVGHAHRPDGKFMSQYEIDQIEAHAPQIAEGLGSHASVSEKQAADEAAAMLANRRERLFNRINEVGLPDFAAGPDYRKATGMSREEVQKLGFAGYDDAAKKAAEYKVVKAAEQAALGKQQAREAAKAARIAEANEKARIWREEADKLRTDAAQRKADIAAAVEQGQERVQNLAYKMKLENGGELGLKKNPGLAEKLHEQAIERAKAEGHIIEAPDEKRYYHVSDKSSASQQETVAALKSFNSQAGDAIKQRKVAADAEFKAKQQAAISKEQADLEQRAAATHEYHTSLEAAPTPMVAGQEAPEPTYGPDATDETPAPRKRDIKATAAKVPSVRLRAGAKVKEFIKSDNKRTMLKSGFVKLVRRVNDKGLELEAKAGKFVKEHKTRAELLDAASVAAVAINAKGLVADQKMKTAVVKHANKLNEQGLAAEEKAKAYFANQEKGSGRKVVAAGLIGVLAVGALGNLLHDMTEDAVSRTTATTTVLKPKTSPAPSITAPTPKPEQKTTPSTETYIGKHRAPEGVTLEAAGGTIWNYSHDLLASNGFSHENPDIDAIKDLLLDKMSITEKQAADLGPNTVLPKLTPQEIEAALKGFSNTNPFKKTN